MSSSLQDLWAVVTRPADQAGALCETIEAEGGHAIAWPVLEIRPIKLSSQTEQFIADLASYDLIIFISINAVSFGLAALLEAKQSLPEGNVYAVGKTTAKALKDSGVKEVHFPEVASSEGLLAMKALSPTAIKDKKVLIFRGEGGSETLAKGLNQRQVKTVDYVEVYRREKPDSDPKELTTLWQQGKLDLIIITSIAGLDNLFVILGESNRKRLLSTPLLTVSKRVAKYALQKGFTQQILVANSAIDKDIITTMQSWHKSEGTK